MLIVERCRGQHERALRCVSIVKKLMRWVESSTPRSQPIVILSTSRIPVASPKDRLPNVSTSSVIYQFRCGCGTATYIIRTSRPLSQRCREHILRWLERGLQGQCQSTITEHVLTCNCDRSSHFSILYRAQNDSPFILEAPLYQTLQTKSLQPK